MNSFSTAGAASQPIGGATSTELCRGRIVAHDFSVISNAWPSAGSSDWGIWLRGEAEHFDLYRQKASDSRWRIREAVALALQESCRSSMDRLLAMMETWSAGNRLEQRAAVATLCEPKLLRDQAHAAEVLRMLNQITRSIRDELAPKTEPFNVLRIGLGCGWRVVVAAQPELGKPSMEAWVMTTDPNIRWIMRQNLKKKRLTRMDFQWVVEQMSILEK